MGSLTLSKIDRLYWMGRYAERVNTTLRFLMKYYDQLSIKYRQMIPLKMVYIPVPPEE